MNSIRQAIVAPDVAPGRGPFPHAVRAGALVFVSGQGPLGRDTNAPIPGGFAEQVTQTFANLQAILRAAGLDFDAVVKVTVYLSDLSRVPEFNELYAAYFKPPLPARTLVQAGLRGIDVELDVIAMDPNHHSLAGGPV